MRIIKALLCCLIVLHVAGCSKPAGKQQTPAKVSQTVGNSGGTVSNGDSSVSLPAGAVSGNVTITDTADPSAPPPPNATTVGTPYTFGPEGQQFNVPVTVTLSFDPTKIPSGKTTADVVMFTAPAGSTNFVAIGGVLTDATHVAAQTTHFSTFVLGIADPPAGCSVCAEGRCSSYCPTGEVTCGQLCTNTQVDSQNCGACGHACSSDEGCLGGACVPTCGKHASSGCASEGTDGGIQCCPGFSACGNTCADLQNDTQNCGQCGNSCASGEVCQSGSCQSECPGGATCYHGLCAASCPSGTTTCSGACTDTSSDYQNCGSCGHACQQGQACYQGACVSSCGQRNASGCAAGESPDGGFQCCQGFSVCGSTCADLQNDPQNCGACGQQCATGEVCSNGTCGPQCPGGAICFQSICVPSCPSGSAACGSTCADLQNDSQNCGACGTACGSEKACLEGTCVDVCTVEGKDGGTNVSSAPDAGGGHADDGGTSAGCESNTQCPSGSECMNGVCVGGGFADGGAIGGHASCMQIVSCENGCGSSQSCQQSCLGMGSPADQQAAEALETCLSAICSTDPDGGVCSSPGASCQECLGSASQGTCATQYMACVGSGMGPGDAGAVGCQQTGCPSGFVCGGDGACHQGGSADGGAATFDAGAVGCQQTGCPSGFICGGDGACHQGGGADGGAVAFDGGSTGCQQTGCPSGFICGGDGACHQGGGADGGAVALDGGFVGCQQTGCPSGFVCGGDGTCQSIGGPDAGAAGESCQQIVSCALGCNFGSCSANCASSGSPQAQAEFDSLQQCMSASCPSADGGVCATGGSQCSKCEQMAAMGGACTQQYDVCSGMTATSDAGTASADAGAAGQSCSMLFGCAVGCGFTPSCTSTCGAGGSPMAQAELDSLASCIMTACPSSDGGVCATNGPDCNSCEQQATQGACSQQYGACTGASAPSDAG